MDASALYVVLFTDLLPSGLTPNATDLSPMHCGMLCLNTGCGAFFYDTRDQHCYLADTATVKEDPSLEAKNGAIYFSLKPESTSTAAKVATSPPAGFVLYATQGLYIRDFGTATWLQAKGTCEKLGARLPKITTTERNTFYKKKHQNVGSFWLGGSDIAAEGSYVWTDGTPVGTDGIDDWTWSNPDGGTFQNCMEMDKLSGVLGWANGGCDNSKPFFCEIETGAPQSGNK